MMKLAISPSAAALLKVLLAGDKTIMLRAFRSTDWKSLTFIGERHEFEIVAPTREALVAVGLRCEETFDMKGHIVADCAGGQVKEEDDDKFSLNIEALVIAE